MNTFLRALITPILGFFLVFGSFGCAHNPPAPDDTVASSGALKDSKVVKWMGMTAIELRDQLNTEEGQAWAVGVLTLAGSFGMSFANLSAESKAGLKDDLYAWSTGWLSLHGSTLTVDQFNSMSRTFAPSITADRYAFLFGPLNMVVKAGILKLNAAAAKSSNPAEAAKWALAASNLTLVAARAGQNVAGIL